MRFAALSCVLILLAACSDSTTEPSAPAISATVGVNAFVSSSADDGEGSLRAALAEASADPGIKHIKVKGVGTITLATPLVWSGVQAITIDGGDAVIDATGLAAGQSALVADGGGDLSIRDLTVHGAPAYGILVDVPGDRIGVQRVDLDRVTVRNNGLHGALINDQAEYLEDPASTSSLGSPASLAVTVSKSLFEGNGNGAVDYDGFRVNEGGDGSIDAVVKGSTFTGNGADGLELDERGAGDAVFSLLQTSLVNNGFLSEVDPDDGIDVDESGDGDIVATFNNVDASNNAEQGVDLNENDAGDLRVTMVQVNGSGNGQEGIEFEEDDDFGGGGNLIADLKNVTTNGNGILDGDAGLKLREKGVGDLTATILGASASDNAIGGIEIREDAGGTVLATVQSAVANTNATTGLRIRGTGTATVKQLSAAGNPDGNLVADGTVSVNVVP